MGFKFNPFSGNFDQTGSGGGASYIDGEVATYNDLPLDGTAALDSAWLVRSASGVWPVSRKQAGIYIRTATAGSSRDADYTYAGTMPDVFSDANFTIYDDADTSKNLKFQLSGLATGTTSTLTVPASGTIARTSDIPSTFAASAVTSGVFDNARINFAAPSAIGSTTPSSGAFTTLNATNGTITASAPVLDLSQTWNNAAVAFTGVRLNVTKNASANTSDLLNLQIGGVTQFRIRDNQLFLDQFTLSGLYSPAPAYIGSTGALMCATQFAVGNNLDTILIRDGASGTLAQRNGTNAQTFRLYNTFTDASNYERGFMRWSSNVLQIGTEKGGTGSARALEFQTDGTTRMGLSTAGVLTLTTTNTLTVTPSATSSMFGGAACIRLEGVRLTLATGGTDRFGISGGGDVSINTSNSFSWLQRGNISWSADGVMLLRNNASTAFDRLQFGGTTSSFPALKRDSTAIHVRLADDSAFAPLSCGALTLNGNLDASTRDLVTDTTTGTKIGTGTTQKLGFWNATPAVQPAAVADATDAASTQARLNDLLARLRTIGIIAT